tara:strand:+ start:20809 stop:22722 length:1914 start_codon:yes stop_codon:yes gene_type:complete
MANEFKHKSVGTQMTQSEYEAVGGHILDSQAAGDLVYASSTTQLSRLGIGTAGKVLAVNSGATAPEWTADIFATDLRVGEDSQTAIDFGTANEIDFKVDNANRLTLTASALYPATDNQIDLGTSSLEFKDAFFDGTVTSDAFAGPLTGDVTGNADTATALATGRTIGMTGDVVWTSASFTGAGNVTGSSTIQADAVESGMLNDNIISGQTEITSGLADADELLYSDGGVLKRVGLDTLSTKILTGNAATATALATARAINGVDFDGTAAITVTAAGSTLSDTVPVSKGGTNATSLADKAVLITQDSGTDTVSAAAMSTNGQLLIGGTSGPAVATLTEGSNVTITNSDGAITIAAASSDTIDMGDGFVIEDGDGTEVTITENKEVKFVEGAGIDIDWTDTDNGTDADPYDLTFTVDHDAASNFVAAEHYDWSTDISSTATIHANNVTDLHGAGVSGSNNQLLTDDGDGTVTSESNLTFDGSTLTVTGDLTPSGTVTIADGKDVHLDSTQTDNNYSGITATFSNATGSTIAKGKAVYISGDNQIALARANADSTMPAIGIAIADIANSGTGKVLLSGFIHDADILDCTIGGEMYVSEDTAGALTKTLPASSGDRVQVVGVGLHADKMFFNPSYDIVERG